MSLTLIQSFEHIAKLSSEEIDAFLAIVRPKSLSKGDNWIEAGKQNTNLCFLEEGYLQKYYLQDGKEIADAFYFDSDFCADIPSIVGGFPSEAYITAMQPSRLIYFSYANFNQLCLQYPVFEHIYRVLIEVNFVKFYQRTRSFITQTPKERYEYLRQNQPLILEKVTQYHIASYLGISYQHLSRLRAEK